MRSRNIKPGFFKNENLAEIDPLGRLLFAGLWLLADREGRLEDRPKRIKAEVLPYDDCNVDELLNQLAKTQGNEGHPFILRYSLNGKRYIQVSKFADHQSPHIKEKPSSIPPPLKTNSATSETDHVSMVQAPEIHRTSPSDSLIPDSSLLIPDSDTSCSNTEAFELAEYLLTKILQWKSNFKKPSKSQFEKWVIDVDHMIRIDQRTVECIKAVIDFATSDSFWRSNILSAAKLRKQFDQLEAKMQRNLAAKTSPGLNKAQRERRAIMTFDQEDL